MSLSPFLLLPLLAPQETTPQEPTVEERIDALIEKTNALESFYARYKATITNPEEEPKEGTLELAYSAPDRGMVRVDAGDTAFEALWLEDRIYVLGPWEDGQATWKMGRAKLDSEPRAAWRLLEELFPSAKRTREHALDAGLAFSLAWHGLQGTEGFVMKVQYRVSGRSSLLDWLPRLKRDAAEVSVDGDSLLWSGTDSRCQISVDSGFPIHLESPSKEDERIALDLEVLLLNELPESDPFQLTEAARHAQEDQGLAGSMDPNSLSATRAGILMRVQWLLEKGQRTWDDETRTDLEAVLKEFHREAMAERYKSWLEDLHTWTDELVGYLRGQLEDDPPPERSVLETQVAERRESLADGFESALERYLESLPDGEATVSGFPLRDELLSTEQSAATLAFDEVVRDPILAYFDEQTSAALGD